MRAPRGPEGSGPRAVLERGWASGALVNQLAGAPQAP